MSEFFCLVRQRSGSLVLNRRRPGYEALEVGVLRRAVIERTEGKEWVVIGMQDGKIYKGATPEIAIQAFYENSPHAMRGRDKG